MIKKVPYSVRLDPELHLERLRALAKSTDRGVTYHIEQAIEQYLEKMEAKGRIDEQASDDEIYFHRI